MTHFPAMPKLLIGMASLTMSLGTSACATETSAPASAVEAVLLNAQDGPTREAIRVFVREQSGPALIALMMDNENRCWLIHRLQDTVTHLELPNSASCRPYQAL